MKPAHLLTFRLALTGFCVLLAAPAGAATTIGGPWPFNTIIPDNRSLGLSDTSQVNPGMAGIQAVPADPATTIEGPWPVSTIVPDNSSLGMFDTRQVNSGIVNILGVRVTLHVTGGWAGDLFIYVVHDSGYAVLLNRIGRSSASLLGNPVGGIQVTFSDSAPADIHLAANSIAPLTGIYQPDGRTADPGMVLNTSPRSAMLSSFNGLSASGNWTLFAADLSSGEQATVQSWGLEITGVVPEPGTAALCTGVLSLVSLRRRRG